MPNKDIKYYASLSWQLEEDSFSEDFYKEFIGMLWSAKDSHIDPDKEDWKTVSKELRDVGVAGLLSAIVYQTFIASYCLPVVIDDLDYSYRTRKSMIASIMDRLLSVHGSSMTKILSTFVGTDEINEVYNNLIDLDSFTSVLQKIKVNTNIVSNYTVSKNLREGVGKEYKDQLNDVDITEASMALWKEYFYIVLILDTAFLSFFYVFLYHSRTGRFPNTRETIQLIMRDIAIMTTYFGTLAEEQFERLSSSQKKELEEWCYSEMDGHALLLRERYAALGAKASLQRGLTDYLEYTLNKTLFKMGFKERYSCTQMPKPVERAIMIDFDIGRYRFLETKSNNKITLRKIIRNYLRRFFL